MDADLLLAAADAFRRLAEAAAGADERARWYALAERARSAWEAACDPGDGKLAAVNESGRTIGEHHHRSRLSDRDVELIHELHDAGLSLAQVALKFEVARSTVADIVKGRTRSYSVAGHRLLQSREPLLSWASVDEFEVCG